MVRQELRALHETLNRQADQRQRAMTQVGDQLKAINRRVFESGADQAALTAEQEALRQRQQNLATEVNEWRDRARRLLQLPEADLPAYVQQLAALGDDETRTAAQHALYLLTGATPTPDEATADSNASPPASARNFTTPAGRLLERARTEYDLRGDDPNPRKRTVAEFANRSGLAQNDVVLTEIEWAWNDPDPYVRQIARATLIQLHRFRTLHLADFEKVAASVDWLVQTDEPTVIPVLADILGNARTGFTQTTELTNRRFRLMALDRLVRWHTPQAQSAVRAHLMDRDPHVAQTVRRALDDYPGEWSGPLSADEPKREASA